MLPGMKKAPFKWTVDRIRALKGTTPFACVTAVLVLPALASWRTGEESGRGGRDDGD